MKAIETENLTPDIRNEIVRDLVTHMYGYAEKPTATFCKFAVQRLILKYPFMRHQRDMICKFTHLLPILCLAITGLLGKEAL